MPVERIDPEPLSYSPAPPRRRPGRRGVLVALLGGLVALAGVFLFAAAHELTDYDRLVGEHARLHELLWSAFGIALVLAGAGIAAVGLWWWCRGEAG